MSPESLDDAIQQIRRLQEQVDWDPAAALLADHVIHIARHRPAATLVALFAPFPSDYVQQTPGLWFVAGMMHVALNQLDDALPWLTRAADHYRQVAAQAQRLAWINLELARLAYLHDEFTRAQRYLDQAVALAEQAESAAPALNAYLYFMAASLCADIGRVAEGIRYANLAIQHYRLARDYRGEFDSLLTITTLARQAGDYPTAWDAQQQAHTCYHSGALEQTAYVSLLSAETHAAWFQGDLTRALDLAQIWSALVQGRGLLQRRLFATIVRGNVLRALGRYGEAHHFYQRVRSLAAESAPYYLPWVDAQESWLAILQGQLPQAESLIRRALAAADHGQTMSFQVNLGVIYALSGRGAEAKKLLSESMAFYTLSQDRQATCAIAFHLAYLQLANRRQRYGIPKGLLPELRWLERCDNAYFALWWHPAMVSKVALALLASSEHHALGRRMFLQGYLGASAVPALREAAQSSQVQLRATAINLLAQLRQDVVPSAADTGTDVDGVVAAAVEQGLVPADAVPALFLQLRTAAQRGRDNPTAVGVFLLHLQGRSVADICATLKCSPSVVSHTLQAVYEILGVSRRAGRRVDQRTALRSAARQRGLIA